LLFKAIILLKIRLSPVKTSLNKLIHLNILEIAVKIEFGQGQNNGIVLMLNANERFFYLSDIVLVEKIAKMRISVIVPFSTLN